jgi:SDR family mycofactocin-dependent oxidoreductase
MGRLDNKVAFITGGARGQGRSHAVMMAEEGADIITLDLCGQIPSVESAMATAADLEESVRLVEKTGRNVVAVQADVRDFDAMVGVVREGVAQLGRLDFVVANAGIFARWEGLQGFYDSIDVMLNGVFHTCEAAIPVLLEQGQGGTIVITSSVAGLRPIPPNRDFAGPGYLGYVAAKHGVVGLMRAYAKSLAEYSIRCNTVHPTGVNTPMVVNDQWDHAFEETPDLADILANALPVPLVEPSDISNAVIFLCSEQGRYITGVTLPVDAGYCIK